MIASQIIQKYISFFEKKGHKRIENSSLVPQNDPTTLFTSAGMQPLIPYLLGEPHPMGKRLVNVQNCFRAQDIDEVGDNRHTTFFRMLGNWSLGDYFKKEEIPWLWEFLTKELKLPKEKLYITVFKGDKNVDYDKQSYGLWQEIFKTEKLEPKIFSGDVTKNWWSRAGIPDNMPPGEIGGPDTEVYYRFGDDILTHEKRCKDTPVECECGKFLEIANSVFIQYQKNQDGSFKELPNKNVDFGGGLERLLAAVEGQPDVFQTSLIRPIIEAIEKTTNKSYTEHPEKMRIIVDHLIASTFIAASGIYPSNKEQGYILRRLIRRADDHLINFGNFNAKFILLSIAEQYKETAPHIIEEKITEIIFIVEEEREKYHKALKGAKEFLFKKYRNIGDELKGVKEISADDAFMLYSTHGLSPTQIKSLGYEFNEQEFAKKMAQHQKVSRKGSEQKFAGGLADHSEQTIMGHTATHLLHQALRDVLGNQVHQTGSNITSERLRFDFNYDQKLTDGELQKVEQIVNEKIKENLPIHYEMMSVEDAKKLGAIGLFEEKYQDKVKVYFIGNYSKEFCGGPHVDFTSKLKRVKIIKQENIGNKQRRIYAVVG